MPEDWRISDRVAVAVGDDRVAAVRLDVPAQPPVILTDSAAEIWAALSDGATRAQLVELAELHQLPEPALAAFLDQLVEAGLLTVEAPD